MADVRFHVYDPGMGGNGVSASYDTLAEAVAGATKLIEEYRKNCDPEWPWDTDCIAVYEAPAEFRYIAEDGRLVARAVECDRIERPDDVDEDGYSESTDLWFNGVDRYVDYRIVYHIASRPSPEGEANG